MPRLSYDTVEDARMRLLNTIVRYAGRPVYIKNIASKRSNSIVVTFDDLYDSNEFTVKLRDEKWDFSSPPLGYTQHDDATAVYCYRSPERRQAQGLHIERVMYARNGSGIQSRDSRYPHYARLRFPIADDYKPSKFWFKMRESFSSFEFAISRDLCLTNDSLFFHTHKVADVQGDGTIIILNKLFNLYPLEGIFDVAKYWNIVRK